MRKSLKKMVIPSAVFVCVLSPFNLAWADDSNEATLDEVQVHSTVLKDYLVTTEVITAEKIKEMGATNLAEAIKMVPGLNIVTGDKKARLARIRGAATDQTKVYIDGMPAFPLSGIASNSASNLENIPADNIEKIEIIKGPGPVQYGTDYKGGIILITTKSGKGPGQFNLNLSGGSHSSFDNYITYSGSDSKASYYATAGKKQGNRELNNTEFDTEFFNGKIKWNLNKDTDLTLSGYYMNTDREISNGVDQITGQETSATTNKWSGDTWVDGKSDVKNWKYKNFKQTNIALQLDQKTSDKFKYNVKLYHITDGNDLWVLNGNNAANHINTPTHPTWYSSTWTSKGNGIEFTGDLQTDRNNTMTFGTKYNKIDWDSDDILNVTNSGTDKRIGYYFQDSLRLGDKTELTLGVRHDKVTQSFLRAKDVDDSVTDPVFNITHKLDKQNTLRLSAGKSHIFATAKQAENNVTKGYAIPDPEKAKNYELGWKHDFDEKSSLDVAVFNNKITDRIDRIPKTDPWININKTDIHGVELQYNRSFTNRLKGFVNYTYLDSKDTDTKGVETRSTDLPHNTVNYGLTYTVDKFQASVLGHYLGNILTPDETYKKLDSYHTVDLNFNYQQNKNIEYYLHVNNIFDTNYWETYECPGDGINFMAGVTVKM
ncbi:Colicin I receptor precursor [Sporomusa ovata DSM 2662]|nr:TonB-dependent receptor [Sporomusa ovata]EQB27383.1 TonB-dependent receptor [Sporomusa ovata DSM 2662]